MLAELDRNVEVDDEEYGGRSNDDKVRDDEDDSTDYDREDVDEKEETDDEGDIYTDHKGRDEVKGVNERNKNKDRSQRNRLSVSKESNERKEYDDGKDELDEIGGNHYCDSF